MKMTKVVNELVLETVGEIEDFNEFSSEYKSIMEEVANYGISAGTISSLVYYPDINEFYNEYESEILDFLEDLGETESESNLPIQVIINERVQTVVSSVAAEILFGI